MNIRTVDAIINDCIDGSGDTEVDMVFFKIMVNKAKAHKNKDQFWMEFQNINQLMLEGPNYIMLGAELDDQGRALRAMAVGAVAGLWTLITPRDFGLTEPAEIRKAAGAGMILIYLSKQP